MSTEDATIKPWVERLAAIRAEALKNALKFARIYSSPGVTFTPEQQALIHQMVAQQGDEEDQKLLIPDPPIDAESDIT